MKYIVSHQEDYFQNKKQNPENNSCWRGCGEIGTVEHSVGGNRK